MPGRRNPGSPDAVDHRRARAVRLRADLRAGRKPAQGLSPSGAIAHLRAAGGSTPGPMGVLPPAPRPAGLGDCHTAGYLGRQPALAQPRRQAPRRHGRAARAPRRLLLKRHWSELMDHDHLPNLDDQLVELPTLERLCRQLTLSHPPRILLLYGSNRERSFSRLLVEEAARLLQRFGAETRVFDPSGLPLPDDAPDSHPQE